MKTFVSKQMSLLDALKVEPIQGRSSYSCKKRRGGGGGLDKYNKRNEVSSEKGHTL